MKHTDIKPSEFVDTNFDDIRTERLADNIVDDEIYIPIAEKVLRISFWFCPAMETEIIEHDKAKS